jgi:DHA1 family multidrug resistance protein-like MFS transporter
MAVRRRLSPFLWLCLMGGLAIFSSTMSKNPALPLFIRSFGVPPGTLGLIAAASTVTGILVSLPAGILSDLWGRRRVILLSMAVFASAPFLYLLVRSPWQLALVRVYHGLATAILGPVAMAAVADTFQQGRGERMAWYSAATMVGRFLAPTVGGLLILGQDFRFVYLGCGLAGTLALLAATRLPRAAQADRSPSGDSPYNGQGSLSAQWAQARGELIYILTNQRILVTSLAEAAQFLAFGCVETYLPLYLTDIGLQPRQIGPLFTAQALAIALCKPLMGRLSDRWGRTQSIVAGLLLGALVVVAMPQTSAYLLLACLAVLFGVGMATVTASTSALVSDLSREGAYGSALGVLSSIMDVGHTSGPVIGGLLVQVVGYGGAFAGIGGILVLVAVSFGSLVRGPRRGAKGTTSWGNEKE